MNVLAQRVSQHVPADLQTALVISGFTAVAAQVVLLRELFVAFDGNELSIGLTLSLWLLWTALGSASLSRLWPRVAARQMVARLQIAAAIALFVSIVMAQASRHWWNASPGESLGPVPMLVTALVTLSVFCPISGWLFAAGARAYAEASQRTDAEGGSSMYLLEAAGSAIGGVLASVVFVRVFDSLQVASIVAATNLIVASQLLFQGQRLRRAIAMVIVAGGVFALLIAPRIHLRSVQRSWPGFNVVAATNSRYGSIAVVETEGSRSLVQNGVVLFTVPDLASAEEAVHFPLLEHPAPRSVLLIGGGLNGSVAEILRHPTVQQVDYVELDPAVVKLTRRYFSQAWAGIAADARVHTHLIDGRLFVKTTNQHFDVIIVNLPEPHTAQLNRLYTQDFFAEAAAKLAPAGILALRLRGAEEYISPELAEFMGCIRTTLGRVFPYVVAIPGENMHLLATRRGGLLTTAPETLLRRLRERRIGTTYIREYYLPFRMAPDRVADLDKQLAAVNTSRVNRDFTPTAYYFDVALWSAQFSSSYRDAFRRIASVPFPRLLLAFALFIALCAAVLGIRRRPSSRAKAGAGCATVATGLSVMGAEILLLLGFQAVYGYVFDELAVIVAGFMAGMALGSWLALKHSGNTSGQNARSQLRRLAVTQVTVAVLPLVLVGALAVCDTVRGTWLLPIIAHAGFPLIAIVCGFAGGYQFPIAMQVFSAANVGKPGSPGKLYGLDLLGAAAGAMALSAYVLPVFGFFRGAILMTLPSIGALIVIGAALRSLNASVQVSLHDRKRPAP